MWCSCLSYAIVSASLIVKNGRIGLIFTARSVLPKYYLRDHVGLLGIAFLVAIELALLVFWTLSILQTPIASILNATTATIEYTCPLGAIHIERAITAYNILLALLSSLATYLVRNVHGIHSEFSFMILVTVSTGTFLTIEALLRQESQSSMMDRLVHAEIVWLLLTQVVGIKFGARVLTLMCDGTYDLRKLAFTLSSRVTSGGGGGVSRGSGFTSSWSNRSGRNQSRNMETTQWKSMVAGTQYVKGVAAVYTVAGVTSEWISALAFVCRVGDNTFILFISDDVENESKGFHIRSKDDCHLEIVDVWTKRLVVQTSTKTARRRFKVIVEFHSPEDAKRVLENIVQCLQG
ncbi:hypothetical protein BDR26DRAFT_896928 [Obelidium mucronatum]|nr:hypothetical protein BDR26DRAFT_896928 [Obelidium mucronatum]